MALPSEKTSPSVITEPPASGSRPPLAVVPLVPVIAGFQILEKLGGGRSGIVYRARQELTDQIVAIKVYSTGGTIVPPDVETLHSSVRLASTLRHPYVAASYEAGECNGRPYLVTEYLPGGTLAARLQERSFLEPSEAASVVSKIARGLQALHDFGIVHRNLVASNILFDGGGEPKVTDIFAVPAPVTGPNPTVDSSADVYALGTILYECLTGRPPFRGPAVALAMRVAGYTPTTVGTEEIHVPRDLEKICLQCLAAEPGDRYGSAAELALDLGRFLSGEAVLARLPRVKPLVERSARSSRWRRRLRRGLFALGLLLAVAAIITVTVILGARVAGRGMAPLASQTTTVPVAQTHVNDDVAVLEAKLREVTSASEILQATLTKEQTATAKARSELAEAAGRTEGVLKDLAALNERLTTIEYGQAIQKSLDASREGNTVAARSILDSTPEAHRGWEWAHARRLCADDPLVLRGHRKQVLTVAFSNDGTKLVTSSPDGTARIWDAKTGAELATGRSHVGTIWSAAFSPDGSKVVSTGSDGRAQVWESANGKLVTTLRGHDHGIATASFSPDGARILTAGGDGTARIWNLKTGAELRVFKGHAGWVQCAAFSPDGSRVVTASADGTARVWDPQTGGELLTVRPHRGVVWAAALHPDNSRLVTAGVDGIARIWDTGTGAELRGLHGHAGWIESVAYSPGGTRIATAGADGTVRLWDEATGLPLAVYHGHQGEVRSVAFSSDGTRLASAGNDATVRIRDTRPADAVELRTGPEEWFASGTFSGDGRRAFSVAKDGSAQLWDVPKREVIATLPGHRGGVTSSRFSPDGSLLLTVAANNEVALWDAATGAEAKRISDLLHPVSFAGFTPDSQRFVVATTDGGCRTWECRGDSRPVATRERIDPPRACSRDGKLLVVDPMEASARIVDAKSGKVDHALATSGNRVLDAVFAPDSSRLLTMAGGTGLRLWDPSTGRELASLRGHTGEVRAMAFSPDNQRIATASADGTARVWDAKTGAELCVLRGHRGEVFRISFSPDGADVVTVGADQTLRTWHGIAR